MTHAFDARLGRVLGAGVTTSAALLAAGLVLSLFGQHPSADMLLRWGLLVLMATPMARVVVSCVEYIRQRDWFFALSCLGVLAVLAATVWVASRG